MSIVEFAESGHVAVITLNRPEARNAINPAMANALGTAVDRLENDPNLHVGVLTATVTEPRPVFCAGDDLREIHGEPAVTANGGFAGLIDYPRTKPLIAAVDGLATSGGCEIVLSCDLVVATRRSSFAVAEVRWGLAALAGGVIRLPRLIGRAPAMDMILTGQPITAERAHQLGLVSTLTDDDALVAAMEKAQLIATHRPDAVRINLEAAHAAWTLHEDELWKLNERTVDAIFNAPDFADGVAGFERRDREAVAGPGSS